MTQPKERSGGFGTVTKDTLGFEMEVLLEVQGLSLGGNSLQASS